MIDAIKKTLLAGVGAAVVTKEKIEASLGDFVAQGKVTADEARGMAEQIARDGRAEFETVSNQLGEKLQSLMATSAGMAQDRLRAMEERLRKLEARTKAATPPRRKKSPSAKARSRPRTKRHSA